MSRGAAPGFPETLRHDAATLFWEAFGPKLSTTLGPPDKAIAFVARVLRPDHAFAILSDQGALLGIAGFKSRDAAFVGGGFSDLVAVYGRFGALWRSVLLSFLERDPDPEVMLMDGICVTAAARGQGIGTRLLHEIVGYARSEGFRAVRLDVIDANPRARVLYERFGFKAVGRTRMGLVSPIFGFKAATTMIFEFAEDAVSPQRRQG